MIVNEISLVIKNIRVLMSYFPEEDFTVINGAPSRGRNLRVNLSCLSYPSHLELTLQFITKIT